MRSPWPPLAVKDKVIVGMAGGEYGIRGFLEAYEAKTGQEGLALSHHSGARRTGERDLGGRLLEDRRGLGLVDGLLRPGTEPALLGIGTPAPTGTVTCARATISIRLGGGPESRQRPASMAFPVHSPRPLGLRCRADSGPGRHGIRRPGAQAHALGNRNGFYYVLDRTDGRFLLGKAFATRHGPKAWMKTDGPSRGPGPNPAWRVP